MPKAASSPKAAKVKKTAAPRAPSAYNLYMKKELPAYKAKHPKADHKEAFKAVAQAWKTHPDNKNKK